MGFTVYHHHGGHVEYVSFTAVASYLRYAGLLLLPSTLAPASPPLISRLGTQTFGNLLQLTAPRANVIYQRDFCGGLIFWRDRRLFPRRHIL